MKRTLYIICVMLLPLAVSATDYVSVADITHDTAAVVQTRVGADFDFKFKYLTLTVGEDIRANFYPAAEFVLSSTNIGISAPIIKGYLSGNAGYMLRMRGTKLTSGDVNKILRHRVYFGLTQHVKLGMNKRFSLSLRERAVLDMRTDNPNLYEKQAFRWEMRYRLQLQYKAESQPLTPYLWTELNHTCNATDAQKYYNKGHNYINAIRTSLGLKWKLDANNSLNFYLRYDWLRDIDVDTNKAGTTIKSAIDSRQHQAIIGVAYSFGYKVK